MNKLFNGIRQGRARTLSGWLISGALLVSPAVAFSTTISDTDNHATHVINPRDPYEDVNRSIFDFNNTVDDYVGKPISNAYIWAMPQFMRTGVSNFFNNLKSVNVILNDMLQAQFAQSLEDTGRMAVNSTVGIGGLFDVADHIGLPQHDEDFEQTLAVWGVPSGAYLVLPIMGPTTVRGIPGILFDTAANPATYISVVTNVTAPVQTLNLLNARANADGVLNIINDTAIDPYAFTREAVFQWRKSLETNGKYSEELLEEEYNEPKKAKTTVLNTRNSGNFAQASQLFGNATQSFADVSKSFQVAEEKLDSVKLSPKASKKAKHSAKPCCRKAHQQPTRRGHELNLVPERP